METFDTARLFIIAKASSYMFLLCKVAIIRWWIYLRLEFIILSCVIPVFFISNTQKKWKQSVNTAIIMVMDA